MECCDIKFHNEAFYLFQLFLDNSLVSSGMQKVTVSHFVPVTPANRAAVPFFPGWQILVPLPGNSSHTHLDFFYFISV